jgi:5-methylcytosine-specific restriction enzyme subunit McrC
MNKDKSHISVFEHETLKLGRDLTEDQLEALQAFHGEKGVPYYALVHQGVKFKEYVGVLNVGRLVIEVLPKADKGNNYQYWKQVLVGMLRASSILNVTAPSYSDLQLQKNSILDMYFELYVSQLQSLIHRGLSKKYRKREGQLNSYKGQVIFSKQIAYNLVHQERTYSRHTVFDYDHLIHQILGKALRLLSTLSTSPNLHGKISDLLLRFPEVSSIKVDESLFSRVVLSRNTLHYAPALEIAKLILLNYHPDVKMGRNHVLALMFDMNLLWERFVYQSLKSQLPKAIPGIQIKAQHMKGFWQPEFGKKTNIVPDISITSKDGSSFIIDTKWKNLDDTTPSTEDLRQLFVYHEYYSASKVCILYPGKSNTIRKGTYLPTQKDHSRIKECALMPAMVENQISKWQQKIADNAISWMNS